VAIDARLVTRAQHGERAAFDELFRLHAHPAWRLAIAVGGSAEIAEQAVVEAFTNVFRRLQGGSASIGTPFRHLVARAAADAAAGASASGFAPAPDGGPNALAVSFRQLPRQWRAVLWLTEVEGGSTAQAGSLLGLSTDDAAALAGRARAGLRQRLLRTGDRSSNTALLADMAGSLRPIVTPMPVGVATAAGAWWAAWHETMRDERRHGLAGFLSLGPRAERALAGAAAVVLAAGIASAIALGGDEATRRSPIGTAAGSGELADGTAVLSGTIDGGPGGTATSSKTWARNRTGRGETVSGATGSSTLASPAPIAPRTPTAAGPTTPPTTQPPAIADSVPPGTGANIAIDAGGTPIAVGVGDQTGVQVGSIEVGTAPSAPTGGASIEINTGGILPPITILLP
jgi:DNA-directed RNA polymerase specialized sigma24 family protein